MDLQKELFENTDLHLFFSIYKPVQSKEFYYSFLWLLSGIARMVHTCVCICMYIYEYVNTHNMCARVKRWGDK